MQFKRLVRIFVMILAAAIFIAIFMPFHRMPSVAWDALTHTDQFEVFEIEPQDASADLTHFTVIGKVTIADAKTRKMLRDALRNSASDSDAQMASCFNPHHGIRVTKDGVATDFVICFECGRVQVWRDGQRIAYFAISHTPQPLFESVLGTTRQTTQPSI